MKKKLLFVINALNKGGAEVALINLLNNLDREKYEIDLLVYDQPQYGDAVSLIGKVPSWVNLFNPTALEGKFSIAKKVFYKTSEKFLKVQKYRKSVIDFVKRKKYDCAFSYGEWFAPEIVANEVTALVKAVWIHTDISKADYFNSNEFFVYDNEINYYIFVSEQSKIESLTKYNFIESKALVIYNMCDEAEIKNLSNEEVSDFEFTNIPTVVTVANIRNEKNHLRQIDVFMKLREKGLKFKWLNIGSTADKGLFNQLKQKISENKMEDDFILIGARENPYKYIKKCDIVAVLSDFESWSVVITESKLLNKPVITTKTSGGLEQIEHNKTGVLTDFSIEDIENKLQNLIIDKALRLNIEDNLKTFISKKTVIEEFEGFMETVKKYKPLKTQGDSILYIIDSINYHGGAHVATKYQAMELIKNNRDVSIFSNELPNFSTRSDFLGVKFINWKDLKEGSIHDQKLLDCIFARKYSIKDKFLRIKLSYYARFKNPCYAFDKVVFPKIKNIIEKFDIVCVTSEGSLFRSMVSQSNCKKKIQWIHTNYNQWSQYNNWTKKITSDDQKIYCNFDNIIFVSEVSRNGFAKKYPKLEHKTEVVKNYMPVEKIRSMALSDESDKLLKIVTVGRLESEKAFERIINVAKKLVKEKYFFTWEIVGDGILREKIIQLIKENKLEDVFKLYGSLDNPFKIIKNADVFALFSYYEGLPNTIYESLILGTPVIATNVGGISEQLEHGVNGWLVENNESSIYDGLKTILDHPEHIIEVKNRISNYNYDNESIRQKVNQLFT